MKTFGIIITADGREHGYQVTALNMSEALQEAAKIAYDEFIDIENVNVEELKMVK